MSVNLQQELDKKLKIKNNKTEFAKLTWDEQFELQDRILELKRKLGLVDKPRNPDVECFGCGA